MLLRALLAPLTSHTPHQTSQPGQGAEGRAMHPPVAPPDRAGTRAAAGFPDVTRGWEGQRSPFFIRRIYKHAVHKHFSFLRSDG